MATSTDADVKAKEINLYWEGYIDVVFEVVFYNGRKQYFDFCNDRGHSNAYVLVSRGDVYREDILLHVNTTYKTQPETNIPKCLQVLRRKFMDPRWDDPDFQKKP